MVKVTRNQRKKNQLRPHDRQSRSSRERKICWTADAMRNVLNSFDHHTSLLFFHFALFSYCYSIGNVPINAYYVVSFHLFVCRCDIRKQHTRRHTHWLTDTFRHSDTGMLKRTGAVWQPYMHRVFCIVLYGVCFVCVDS